MKEAKLLGKLLPTHPDILPILDEIRKKYDIEHIKPDDDSLKELLKYGLEIDWETVHAEILEKVRETDFLPEKTKEFYLKLKELKYNPVDDPELEKLSEDYRNNILTLFDLLLKQYDPFITGIDEVYRELTNHCLEYLLTGVAREVPQEWFIQVDVMDSFGEKIVFAMASQAADPDEVAEMFKKKYYSTFGKYRPKITEKHIKTADYLRMQWEGKSVPYLLEEEDISEPQENEERSSSRHSTTTRKRHAKMRQNLHRLKNTIYKLVA